MNYYNYFTEIEDHFVRRRGKHLLISPMDWSLIATWRESGVPLHVALRGIDVAMDTFQSRRQRSGKVNSLFYCHESVMAEYARHLDSRLGEEGSQETSAPKKDTEQDDGLNRSSVLEFLASRISEIKSLREKQSGKEDCVLREGIERVLSRLEDITQDVQENKESNFELLERDLGILDEALVSELRASVSSEQMLLWEEEAKKELKVYRKRLPKETYQKILDNFLRDKLHRRFEVGGLSLLHL